MSALAPYATDPGQSRGRLFGETGSAYRTAYQRDRDRVVHATAFRRLEYKTQVFMNFEGDHFRTRLTHSLEVAQIARSLARALRVDEDLAEAVSLAHDLGHPAFGHAGETALDEAARDFGGFDHNIQTFRVLTELERRYAGFDGLDLTVETLEGVLKHNGPMRTLPVVVAQHPMLEAMQLHLQAPLEAQISAIADDVAYCNHDLDDGLRADFFSIDELLDLPLIGGLVREVDHLHPDLDRRRRRHEVIRRLIDRMVVDILDETRKRIERQGLRTPQCVRQADRLMATFSEGTRDAVTQLREFLRLRMYRHFKVNRMALKAQRVVAELFAAWLASPQCLPTEWQKRADGPGTARTAHSVRDYIAGMTDRFALDEHDRLFRLTRYQP